MKTDINIVVIGGGSGISVILRGIKRVTENITAIVTVADDGGSSGLLREDLGMLPPGDIRNCILALSNTEPIMEKLMQYRFKEESLKKHNIGNIIIAALVEMTGSFESALTHIHDIFAVTGKVMPVSLDDMKLEAELEDGSIVRGESKISYSAMRKNVSINKIYTIPEDTKIFDKAKIAIENADIILIGPGSLYTSILPNLIVKGMKESLLQSKAKIVLCANLLTQAGETVGMEIEDHLSVIEKHIGAQIFDAILINNKKLPKDLYKSYLREGAKPLFLSKTGREIIDKKGIQIIEKALVETKAGYIRHEASVVAKELVGLAETRIFKK